MEFSGRRVCRASADREIGSFLFYSFTFMFDLDLHLTRFGIRLGIHQVEISGVLDDFPGRNVAGQEFFDGLLIEQPRSGGVLARCLLLGLAAR